MKRAIMASFAASGLVLLSNAAAAQQMARSPTGAEFLQACQAGDKACYWLILGLAETLNARNASSDREIPPEGFNACVPAIKADDLVRNVIGVMLTSAKVSPQLFQTATPAPLITSTLSKLYPCKLPAFQPPG